ncbi:MAG: acetyl-CoA carboxylase biotin carboxyl carrier protein subunit [Rubricoccaceae bacterium]
MALDVRTGDLSLSLDMQDGTLLLDGEPVDARISRISDHSVLLVLNGHPHVLTIERNGDTAHVTQGGTNVEVTIKTETALLLERFGLDAGDSAAEREIRAPMPGLVLRVLAEPGQDVTAGQGLVVLEAMKMENELKAPADGTIATVHTEAGAAVGKNDLLIELAE